MSSTKITRDVNYDQLSELTVEEIFQGDRASFDALVCTSLALRYLIEFAKLAKEEERENSYRLEIEDNIVLLNQFLLSLVNFNDSYECLDRMIEPDMPIRVLPNFPKSVVHDLRKWDGSNSETFVLTEVLFLVRGAFLSVDWKDKRFSAMKNLMKDVLLYIEKTEGDAFG